MSTQTILYVNIDEVLQEPGSEVYKKALEMTQKAIILFPEISLTCSAFSDPPRLMCMVLYVQAPALHAELQKQLQSSQVSTPLREQDRIRACRLKMDFTGS